MKHKEKYFRMYDDTSMGPLARTSSMPQFKHKTKK